MKKKSILKLSIIIVFLLIIPLFLKAEKPGNDILKSHKRLNVPANAIITIKPYWHNGTWVFDDERTNLVKEPFVAGIPEMINQITKDIPDAKKGFRLIFYANPFPGYTIKLNWLREEHGGNWYYSDTLNMKGWLCPALFHYFPKAPKELYAKAEPIDG